jgi:Mg2+-importing ATPase
VDPEYVALPRRWDIAFIGRFMIEFGILSSAFDLLTFLVLLRVFKAAAPEFQTGWFVESLLTELVVALVVRTRRPFYKSRPGSVLLWTTVVLIVITVILPYLPFTRAFGFVSLPASLMVALVVVVFLYVAGTELLKRRFYAGRV